MDVDSKMRFSSGAEVSGDFVDCEPKFSVAVVEVASSLEVNPFKADSFGDVEESVVVGHVSSFCSGAVLAPVIGATINVMAATIAIVMIVV